MVRVKICGITDEAALDAAVAAGADFIGLVFHPPSPRHLELPAAAALAQRLRMTTGAGDARDAPAGAAAQGASAPAKGRRPAVVALVVDADDALLRAITEQVRPDYVQAHGAETPQRLRQIGEITDCPVIKAFRLRTADDLAAVQAHAGVMAFPLFDAWHPDAALPGGTGKSFDWSLLAGWRGRAFMLAGGLRPENVGAAIRLTGAPMVDVSSGVERRRGVKDPRLIHRFVQAAQAAGKERA